MTIRAQQITPTTMIKMRAAIPAATLMAMIMSSLLVEVSPTVEGVTSSVVEAAEK